MYTDLETLKVRVEGAVAFAEIDASPLNLLGPELIRDLVTFIKAVESDKTQQVVVFQSADPDFFISHVDITRIKENRAATMGLSNEPSIGLLLRRVSTSRLVTIAKIAGRVRGVGSEFVLACDMRFAAKGRAIFSQFESAFGLIPGAGGVQHLVRQMGRARALEAMLGAEDFDAELADRYGWINRALPPETLDTFVDALAHRIARFPAAMRAILKERINAIALPPADDIRRDSDLFLEGAGTIDAQNCLQFAMKNGFQTRDGEMNLTRLLFSPEKI